MTDKLTEILGEEWSARIDAKSRQQLRIIRHLRDGKISVRRAAKAACIKPKHLHNLIASDWFDFSVEQMTRIADAICALPQRRFSLVSARLEGWRTPPEKLRAQDVKTRKAMLRYFETHPDEEGSERAIQFLKSQLDTD